MFKTANKQCFKTVPLGSQLGDGHIQKENLDEATFPQKNLDLFNFVGYISLTYWLK